MRRMSPKLFRPAALALAGCLLLAPAGALAQDDAAARKERILANLRLQFPQLEEMNATVGDLSPSEFAGLDIGSFSIPGRGEQKFLVSHDDTKLWLVSGDPIDVSLSAEQVQAKIAEREAAKARAAAEMNQKLEDAIKGLPVRGKPDAPVTIIEFSDFQCPYCARGANTVEQLLEKYPDDVKFVFKHFPLNFHPWAKPAAIASHCAGLQDADAFWTLHDKYFEAQRSLNPGNVLDKSKEFLAGSEIDMGQWSACAEDTGSDAYKAASAAVDADMALGQSLGVSGTPGFFVNGTFLNGAQPVTAFEPLIEKAKALP